MKKLLFVLFASVLLVSCSKGPESAAKNFAENIAKGNIEEAKKYATPASQPILNLMAGFSSMSPKYPDYKFKMTKDSIEGDSVAWVTYTTPEGKEDVLNLKKDNGEWKVSVGK